MFKSLLRWIKGSSIYEKYEHCMPKKAKDIECIAIMGGNIDFDDLYILRKLTIKGICKNGRVFNLINKRDCDFKSSNDEIIAVNEIGLVVALSYGMANINVTLKKFPQFESEIKVVCLEKSNKT